MSGQSLPVGGTGMATSPKDACQFSSRATACAVSMTLGLWIAENEGAKFWLSVMNELKNRGVQDILIAVVDGLKGFPEAITAAFPEAMVQTCIAHLVRHSLNFCSWKDRKAVATEGIEAVHECNADVDFYGLAVWVS